MPRGSVIFSLVGLTAFQIAIVLIAWSEASSASIAISLLAGWSVGIVLALVVKRVGHRRAEPRASRLPLSAGVWIGFAIVWATASFWERIDVVVQVGLVSVVFAFVVAVVLLAKLLDGGSPVNDGES